MNKAQCKSCGKTRDYKKTRSTRLHNLAACICGIRNWIKTQKTPPKGK